MKAYVTTWLKDEDLQRLKKYVDEIIYKPWRETYELYFDAEEFAEKIGDAEILIAEVDEIKSELIEKTNLKIIAAARQDPFKIDVNAATKKNIPVLYTPARNANSVADLAVLMMLSLLRNLTQIDRFIHSDDFEITEFEDYVKINNDYIGRELNGLTVGIIGFGNIGRLVGKRVKAFGANVLVFDPYIPDELVKTYGRRTKTIEALVKESDIITIHAAPGKSTKNIISKEMIDLMKPDALLINTAKGDMVDLSALLKALKDKKIGGAGLDVFDIEPIDEDNEFIPLNNTIVLPHLGGNTHNTVQLQSKMIVDDIIAILEKREPKNILNPEVLGIKKLPKSLYFYAQDIVDMCHLLVKEKLIEGSSGNVSVRVPNSDIMLITPSTVNYNKMTAEDIVQMDINTGKQTGGNRNPSVEKDLHMGIYRARDDVGAVIHTHGKNAIAFSLTQNELPAIMEEFIPYVGGTVRVAEYAPAGSEELAENIIEALEDKNAAIAKMHGGVCCGSHLQGALTVTRLLEKACEIFLLARPLGELAELDEDVVDDELDMYEIFKESKKV